jgi:hypothetical protein
LSPDSTGEKQARRASNGRFRSGASGNPAGRPRGAGNRITADLREVLESEGVAVVSKAVEMAKAGDRLMLRLVVDKLLPRAGREASGDIPELGRAGDVVAGVAAIIKATSEGRMDLDQAKAFAAMLELERRAIETHDLQVRIDALERSEGER